MDIIGTNVIQSGNIFFLFKCSYNNSRSNYIGITESRIIKEKKRKEQEEKQKEGWRGGRRSHWEFSSVHCVPGVAPGTPAYINQVDPTENDYLGYIFSPFLFYD